MKAGNELRHNGFARRRAIVSGLIHDKARQFRLFN